MVQSSFDFQRLTHSVYGKAASCFKKARKHMDRWTSRRPGTETLLRNEVKPRFKIYKKRHALNNSNKSRMRTLDVFILFPAKGNSTLLQTIQIQMRQFIKSCRSSNPHCLPLRLYIFPNFLLDEKRSCPIFIMEESTLLNSAVSDLKYINLYRTMI